MKMKMFKMVKIKMVQEQWLQLKIKLSVAYNMKKSVI